MNCYNCKIIYNLDQNIPRLLTQCGHSLCEMCAGVLFQNCKIVCPECKMVNYAASLSSFPKNLALLNMYSLNSQEYDQFNSTTDRAIKSTGPLKVMINLYQIQYQKISLAFCEFDNKLICVTCIIQDGYRNHNVQTIFNVFCKNELQAILDKKNYINDSFEKSQNMEEQLNLALQSISQNTQICIKYEIIKVLNQATSQIQQIEQFFESIQRIILDRKNELIDNINSLLNVEQQQLDEEKNKFNTHLQDVKAFQKLFKQLSQEQDIEVLLNFKQINEFIQNACQQINKIEFAIPFSGLNKDSEISNIIKSLQQNQKQLYHKESQEVRKHQKVQSETNYNFMQKKKTSNVPFKNKLITANQIKIQPLHQQQKFNSTAKPLSIKNSSSEKQLLSQQVTPKSQFYQKMYLKDGEKIQDFQQLKLRLQTPHVDNQTPKNGRRLQSQDENQNKSVTPKNSNKNVQDQDKNSSEKKKITFVKTENNSWLKKQVFTIPMDLNMSNEIQPINDKHSYDKNFIPNDISKVREEISSRVSISFLNDFTNKIDYSLYYKQHQIHLLLIGGSNDSEDTVSSIQKLDQDSNQWKLICNLKEKIHQFGCLTLSNQKIMVLGGKINNNIVNSVFEYDAEQNSFFPQPLQLTQKKYAFGCVSGKQDEIYIAGGNDGQKQLNDFECYHFGQKKILKMSSCNVPRDQCSLVWGIDQNLYLIGGSIKQQNQCVSVASVEKYNFQSNKWQSIESLNRQRRGHQVITMPDGIFVIGGFDGFLDLNSVERYDFMNKKWINMKSMNVPRSNFAAIQTPDNQYIYVYGGQNTLVLDSVERYSIINNLWEIMPKMPFSKYHHKIVMIKNQNQ